jgi:hypothetical protein
MGIGVGPIVHYHAISLDFKRMYFLVTFGLSFITYILTLAPTVYNLDSAELTTAAATLGLTRSTGYPLYILLGHLWSKIPVGDVGYRLNIFSAFTGAVSIGLIALILKHLQVKWWASFCALGLLATSKFFWALSSIAEVYTLQTALMAGLILCILRWQERPTPYRMAFVGFIAGLCLCHHAASVLMVPAVILFFLFSTAKKPFQPKMLGMGLTGLLIGLIPYLYFPLRYHSFPVFNYAGSFDASGQFHPLKLDTLKGLWTLISGKSFSDRMFTYTFSGAIREIRLFMEGLWRSFLVIGIGPGFFGAFVLFKRNWQAGWMLVIMFIFHTLFFINYQVVDKETMFLPSYLVWTIWLGVGYDWLIEILIKTKEISTSKRMISESSLALWTFRCFIAGAVVVSVIWKYPIVNQADDWSTRQLGEQILSQVEPNALIFGYWNVVPVIEYLKLVEGQRPDVQAVNRFLVPQDDLTPWIFGEISHRPVYIDNCLPDLPKNIECISEGELYHLLEVMP